MLTPHVITVLTAVTSTDRKNARQQSWDAPAQRTCPGYVQPRSSSEDHQPESNRIRTSHALFATDPTITAQERIRWAGKDFLIVGDVQNHMNGAGAYHHTEADLQIVTG